MLPKLQTNTIPLEPNLRRGTSGWEMQWKGMRIITLSVEDDSRWPRTQANHQHRVLPGECVTHPISSAVTSIQKTVFKQHPFKIIQCIDRVIYRLQLLISVLCLSLSLPLCLWVQTQCKILSPWKCYHHLSGFTEPMPWETSCPPAGGGTASVFFVLFIMLGFFNLTFN